MSCWGYVTCSLWSKRYVRKIFGPIACIKIFFQRKTRRDGSFCNLILTLKGVCRYQKCCKKCCFSWFFEFCQPVKYFGGEYRPSTRIVVLPYILKNSQKKFGVITMKTSHWRRKNQLDFWNLSLVIETSSLSEVQQTMRANTLFYKI